MCRPTEHFGAIQNFRAARHRRAGEQIFELEFHRVKYNTMTSMVKCIDASLVATASQPHSLAASLRIYVQHHADAHPHY